MTSIRQAIADAIYDSNDSWMSYPDANEIKSVEFRRGCAEIEVKHQRQDSEYPDFATIDAAPILTALLQQAIDKEAE